MGDGTWLRRGRRRKRQAKSSGGAAQQSGKARGKNYRCSLGVEPLEDRRMLVTYLVTSTGDVMMNNTVFGSLRWALEQANDSEGADEIVFADSVTAITLNGGQLDITGGVSILGPGPRRLTITQSQNNRRIFNIDDGDDDEIAGVQISGLTMTGGNITGDSDENRGGAIFNKESLTMIETVVEGNSASRGGGAIYVERGSLNISRSLLSGNNSNHGGAIWIGSDDEDVFPNATIADSTITGNVATGGGNDNYDYAYGGGVFVRQGVLTITSSTVVFNQAINGFGGGVAVYGAEPPETEEGEEPPPPPDPTSFIVSSIVTGNGPDDIASVGMTDDEEEPMPFLPLVASDGYNIIGVLGMGLMAHADDLPLGTNPGFLDLDGMPGPDLADYGGSTDVYMLSDSSPALDAGSPDIESFFEQRGRHYTRTFDYTGAGERADIGATERQEGTFVVDELFDESEGEGQTSGVYELVDPITGTFTILGYDAEGDFTIREALSFARKNTDPSVISFSERLRVREFEDDPNSPVTPATIRLTLGPLSIFTDTVIEGPSTFILEVDASGNDPTPGLNEGNGSRVFVIDNGAPTNFIDVSISNLTLMGADSTISGGAIFNRENLSLANMTFKENSAINDGGAIFVQSGTVVISGTTFVNNRATDDGGALFVDSFGAAVGDVTVVNSTFSANTAGDRGAAIANNNGRLLIEYSTITLNNSGSLIGSGIWSFNGANAQTEVRSTIVSGNIFSDVDSASPSKITSLGYNFVGVGNAAGAFIMPGDRNNVTNPMLGPLINAGGLTDAHQPLAGSPVVDAGDPAAAPGSSGVPRFDQRGFGFTRVFDGDVNGAARIDIGATELQSAVFVVSTPQDENNGNYSFGNLSLREAIQLANANPLVDTIEFDPMVVSSSPVFFLSGANLALGTPVDMQITTSMNIVGPGALLLALDGSGLSNPQQPLQGSKRTFTISNGSAQSTIDVNISGLEFRNAATQQAGGVIWSLENLTLDDVTFNSNQSVGSGFHGGAVFQQGASLSISNALISGNHTNGANSDGGAIYATDAEVSFVNLTITGNSTLAPNSDGGAIFLKNSNATWTDTTISGNSTAAGSSDGGGAFIDSSTVLLEGAVISGNSTSGSNSEGGGLFVAGGSSQVTLDKSSVISLNSTIGSQSSGGGAFVGGGTLTINNGAIIQNQTSGAAALGGGVAVQGGSLRLTDVRVIDNRAAGIGGHGGGVSNVDGNLVIRNSSLSLNRATHAQSKGGAVYSDTNLSGAQTTSIVNSTISGNSAPLRGGGVFNADGRTQILHSTITNNSASTLNVGSGVASQGNAATLTVVQSSIIAGNVGAAAGTGSDVDSVDAQFANSFQSLGNNLIGIGNSQSAFTATGDKVGITNPLLGPLAFNGGATQTHALLAGSPAINAGSASFNPNAFTPPLSTDQRGVGFARVQGGRIDAGAFESSFTAFTSDFDADADVDGSDFLRWQRGIGKPNAVGSDGDANGDAKVDGADLLVWRSEFGAVAGTSTSAAAAVSGGEEVLAPSSLASEGGPIAVLAMRPQARDSYRASRRGALPTSESVRQAALADWAESSRVAYDDLSSFASGEANAAGDSADEDAVFAMLAEDVL